MIALPSTNGTEIRYGALRVIKNGTGEWVALLDGTDDFRWGDATAIRQVIAHVMTHGTFRPSKYTRVY